MWATITKPFAWVMIKLYELTGDYGLAVVLFALIVNLILAPFMAKSKKSTMRTTRLQPQIQELQRRHEGNQQKLNQEMQKLYREEGINPMSGCLWSLIPFPILIALYSIIRQPLSRMMYLSSDAVEALKTYFVDKGLYTIPAKADAYVEIKLADLAHTHWDELQQAITAGTGPLKGVDFSNLLNMDFTSLGLNLGSQPNWRIWALDMSNGVWPVLGLFLIPLLSAFLSWLSMKISNMANPPQANPQTEASMKSMTLMMPLMSLWFCFIMPAVMGVYWIANSLISMVRDYSLTKIFKKQLDAEDAEKNARRKAQQELIELRQLETERKRQAGTTTVNENTSKKKLQAGEKQKSNERKAALDKEERAARREMLGIEDNEIPASQVGNRRYARGRAYDPYRFSTPETAAEELTASAEDAVETVSDAAAADEIVKENEND